MKTHQHKGSDGNEYLFVNLPEGAHMISYGQYPNILYYTDQKYNDRYDHLPSGRWEILGRSNELSEEQAAWIVEETNCYKKIGVIPYRFKSYINGFVGLAKAKESLSTLSQSLGFDNPLILKKIN